MKERFLKITCLVVMLLLALWPGWAWAAPLGQEGTSKGLVGPILLLILIVLLDVFALAFAFRLRRNFRQISGEADEER